MGPRDRGHQDQGNSPQTGRDQEASRLRRAGPARDLTRPVDLTGHGQGLLCGWRGSPHTTQEHVSSSESWQRPGSWSWEGNFTALQSWLREPHWTHSSCIERLRDVCLSSGRASGEGFLEEVTFERGPEDDGSPPGTSK